MVFWLTPNMASGQSGPLKNNYFWPRFMTSVAYALQCNNSVSLAILDFAKAFDKVPQRGLLSKLDYYGIRSSLHS